MNKHVVQKKVGNTVSTFAILDKLSDIEDLLDHQVDSQKKEGEFIKIEKTYNDLKEELFESFYTSSDIEDIIIDTQHRHHELVMRLYHEYMDDESFLDFENIEPIQEESETHFYFTDSSALKTVDLSYAYTETKLDTDISERTTNHNIEVYTSFNVSEIYKLENKIESLLALLGDLVETYNVSYKTIQRFLSVTHLIECQDQLTYIISSYSLKQKKYSRKMESIEKELTEYMRTRNVATQELAEDRIVLKHKRKAAKVKRKVLISLHNTYRDLDLLHEQLFTLYQHLAEYLRAM